MKLLKSIAPFCIVLFMSALIGYADPTESREGLVSWYDEASCKREGTSGIWTASGERFYDEGLTCAMRNRDFGRYYKVTNIENGKSIIVKHNDFGPTKKLYEQGRIIDLSKGAFEKISPLSKGIIAVEIKCVQK